MYAGAPVLNADFDKDVKFVKLWGYGMIFEWTIAKSLNYVSVYNPVDKQTGIPYNSTMLCNFLLVALSQRSLSVQEIRLYFSQDLVMISRDELYTQFEKLFLPFKPEVWIWLIVTILTAILTFIAIKFTPKHVQRFIFGRGGVSAFAEFIVS